MLDIYAPLRTGRHRCGQHDSRSLSDEARQAKQLRRRLSVSPVRPTDSQTRLPYGMQGRTRQHHEVPG